MAGYSNGRVTLLDAEREDQISVINFEEDIKRVYFSKSIKTSDYRSTYRNRTEVCPNVFSLPYFKLSTYLIQSIVSIPLNFFFRHCHHQVVLALQLK